MAEFFRNLPSTLYDLTGNKPANPILIKDITARSKLIAGIPSYVFYKYQIQEGETPEIIADKYYGSSGRHWIVMFANNIVDPQYDWPLSYDAFNKYIESKYGSDAAAKTQIHHYEKTIVKTDSFTGKVTTETYEIDATAYALLPETSTQNINLTDGSTVNIVTTRSIVYAYDYEEQENDKKRNINLIDKIYVNQLETELQNIFKTTGI